MNENEIRALLAIHHEFTEEQQSLLASLQTPLEGIKTLCLNFGIAIDFKFTRIDNI